jgi:phospholipid/cholesterol/gamma-HCH transport system substrate-binding protein
MRERSGTAALIASPVLVGAVTVLITVIAVFIAYNANSGLPFVPTYDVKATLPSGNKLVPGNEVRAGGFRVGAVDEISTRTIGGKARAVIHMKLDKVVEPLRSDTRIAIRPRSALGLKYVELIPGAEGKPLAPGEALPLAQASEGLELEDVFSTFGPETRRHAQLATEGFGDAFAGRGAALNNAIRELNPLFRSLAPVMRNLSDRDTELDRLFPELGRAAGQAAPVADVQARLFTNMADTFAAIGRDPSALQATIERQPGTLEVATRSLRFQRPFLADFADLSRRLRPAARELPRSLPTLNDALRVGTPVLYRSVALNRRLADASRQLEDLFENPRTLMALRDIDTALTVGRPGLEFIAPYQTVCNNAIYFMHALGEHQSQVSPDKAGTVQNQGLKFANTQQENGLASIDAARPADVRPDQDPRGARDSAGNPLERTYAPGAHPAIDAQGNADCQVGQTGYIRGPLATGFRYGPGVLSDGTPTGGNWPVIDDDLPGLRGGTYVTRALGIRNLRDVP